MIIDKSNCLEILIITTILCLFHSSIALIHDNYQCPPAYSNCNLGIDGYINVHLVAHTHDDVGWKSTVDELYYGKHTHGVQYILDTVVNELSKDPNKKFIYVEIAFFARWWMHQNNDTKELVRNLVNEGRLEFINGGWSMNDEAAAYYNDIIDQLSLGLRFILREFGSCARPRIGWQVDPFGHTREQGSIFAQFGYDAVFIGRDDIIDEFYRAHKKTREMIWKASPSLGKTSDIFNGLLPIGYATYPFMCFDTQCSDNPVIDNPESEEYNVDVKVTEFLVFVGFEAAQFRTKNLIMTFGGDFQYTNARMTYKNLDKLIYHVNKISNITKVNVFYSTPSCYLYSLYKSNITWPVEKEDFVPYAHRTHSFWTGFYTSRTALKNYVRRTNNFLQAVRQLSFFANRKDNETAIAFNSLMDAMGIVQHHDAISGTENQHTANDYSKRLARGVIKLTNVISKSIGDLTNTLNLPNLHYCSLLNISECLPIENKDNFSIIIYNPLPRKIETWIKIPIVTNDYKVYLGNDTIKSEIVEISDETKSIPERQATSNYELIFKANLSALGFNIYFVKRNEPSILKTLLKKERELNINTFKSDFSIRNEYLMVNFDQNGNLAQISNLEKTSNITTKLKHEFCYYKAKIGNNNNGEHQSSGAYIFRPDGDTPICFKVSNYSVYHGELFSEVHQVYNNWLSQTIRLYANATNVEFSWRVGTIDIGDQVGKEIIFKITSDIKSSALFSTDSNGRQILKRQRDYRSNVPDYYLLNGEKVSGNYYPVNSRIFIGDEDDRSLKRQLTLVTDRSQGGSSIEDGSIELMLNRRLLHDDSLGVGEPLNELGLDGKGLINKGNIYLIFNTTKQSARVHRELSHRINSQPLITFDVNNSLNVQNCIWNNFMLNDLPSNIHLLTLQQEFDLELNDSIILRLEHFYEIDDDPELSKPVEIDLKSLFNNQKYVLVNAVELNLGANMNVEELDNRLVFREDGSNDNESNIKKNYLRKDSYVIEMEPFQIRTFRLTYNFV